MLIREGARGFEAVYSDEYAAAAYDYADNIGDLMEAVTVPRSVSELRKERWRGVPSSPGIYWWYFPVYAIGTLGISAACDEQKLLFRRAPDGKICLYHGMANNLAERVKWHAEQRLTLSSLRSGFLSTFRLTLLALNGLDYAKGAQQIDQFFDELTISWHSR